ncbi:hypothetical protein ACEQ8H_007492 [Pleosporales sp. CAS-2024a]
MRLSLRPPWPITTHVLRWHPRAPQSIPRRLATTSAANPAPVAPALEVGSSPDVPKFIVPPGSRRHDSLHAFVEYAEQANLSPTSSVYVGTHYEYTTALSLLRLGFSLFRIGASHDAGIDLIGHWVLAPLREPLCVIIQCKARNNSVSPCHLRDLEGSFSSVPAGWKNKYVLALLVTTHKATKGTLKALALSPRPMGFMMVSQFGAVQQFVWNRAAAEQGLEGVGVTLRHTPRALLASTPEQDALGADSKANKKRAKFRDAGTEKDIQLTWMGTPIFPERTALDDETLKLMRRITPKTRISAKPPKPRRKGCILTVDQPPTPRGGRVTARGRPKGSKNKPKVTEEDG